MGEIREILTKVGLAEHMQMPAINLSGGLKRRLCIAMALIGNPQIIIMDEPTSGLDSVARRSLWSVLKNLRQDGKTILLATQFLDEADELSDRVAVMCKGQFFAVGRTEFIKKKFGVGYQLVVSLK